MRALKSRSTAAARPSRSQSAGTAWRGRYWSTSVPTESSSMPWMARREILGAHDLGALLIDHLALIVGDVVEQQQLLADVEVVRFDLALRLLDLAREHAALDHLAFLHAGHLQQPLGAHRIAEDAHQVVFHRQVEAARARIALAARAAAQLIVDAARLVALGADDVQAAGGRPPCRAAAAIAARSRSRVASSSCPAAASSASRLPPSTMSVPRPAMLVAMVTAPGRPGLRDDVRLALVLLGVQHLVRARPACAAARTGTRKSRWRWCRPAPAAGASRSRGCPR